MYQCEICGFAADVIEDIEWVPHPDPPSLDPDAMIRMCRTCAREAGYEHYFVEAIYRDEDLFETYEELDPLFIEEYLEE